MHWQSSFGALLAWIPLSVPHPLQTPSAQTWFGVFTPGAERPTVLELSGGTTRIRSDPGSEGAVAVAPGEAAWVEAVGFRTADILALDSDHHLVAAIDHSSACLVLTELRRSDGTWRRVAEARIARLREVDRDPRLPVDDILAFQSAAILSWNERSRSVRLLVEDEYANVDPFSSRIPYFLDNGVYEATLTLPLVPAPARLAKIVDGVLRPEPDGDCKLVAIGSDMRVCASAGRTMMATRLTQRPELDRGVPVRGTGLLRMHVLSDEGAWSEVPISPVWIPKDYALSEDDRRALRLVSVRPSGEAEWKLTTATLEAGGSESTWDASERTIVAPGTNDRSPILWQPKGGARHPWTISDRGAAFELR